MRILSALILALGLAACTDYEAQLAEVPAPLGDFQPGYLVAVADEPSKLGFSVDVADETWEAELLKALEERMQRYEGGKLYHVSLKVWEYSLPSVVAPVGRSALHVLVTVWDDAAQAKMNDDPKSIYTIKVFEGRLARVARTEEERITLLSREVVKLVEDWLRERHEQDGWFGPVAPVPADAVDTVGAALPAAPDAADAPAGG